MNIRDPKIGKYFIFDRDGVCIPIKVIKYISTGYLCRYYRSMSSSTHRLYKSCKCSYVYKCMHRCLICVDSKYLTEQISSQKGKILIGE